MISLKKVKAVGTNLAPSKKQVVVERGISGSSQSCYKSEEASDLRLFRVSWMCELLKVFATHFTKVSSKSLVVGIAASFAFAFKFPTGRMVRVPGRVMLDLGIWSLPIMMDERDCVNFFLSSLTLVFIHKVPFSTPMGFGGRSSIIWAFKILISCLKLWK